MYELVGPGFFIALILALATFLLPVYLVGFLLYYMVMKFIHKEDDKTNGDI